MLKDAAQNSASTKNTQLGTLSSTSGKSRHDSSHEASSQRITRSTTASGSPTSSEVVNTPATVSDFESFVREALCAVQARLSTVLDGQQELNQKVSTLEREVTTALEFQSSRIDDVSSKAEILKTKLVELEAEMKKMDTFKDRLDKMERHSRRNNLRLVGFPHSKNTNDQPESCIQIVKQILQDFENTDNVQIERAHRDGMKREGKSQHILIKFLSYQDKINIIKQSRRVLHRKSFFFADDLIKSDYIEKRKWSSQVKAAYERGVRYHFAAGHWRDAQGRSVSFT